MVMPSSRRAMLKRIVIVTIAVGISIGSIYGSYTLGRNVGLQQAYFAHALDTRNYLTTLQCLHSQNLPAAQSMLETSLSAGVVLLAPENAILAEHTENAVLDVLGEVKTYRTEHPWTSHGPELTSRVERILSNVQSKPLISSCP